MTYEYIRTELIDGVFTLQMHRPDALNALMPAMLAEMIEALNGADANDDVSVIVLEGAGRAFSAGVDLKILSGTEPKAGRVGDVFDEPAAEIMGAIRNASKPVIGKVHGACFTGALELALHCDFVHTTQDTKFGDTHAKFAIRPTWGMSQTLVQAVGLRMAKELSYTARTISGAEAAQLGIANQAHDDNETLDAAVAKLARQIASNDGATIAAYKDLHRIAETHDVPAGIKAEAVAEYPDITDTLNRIGGFLK